MCLGLHDIIRGYACIMREAALAPGRRGYILKSASFILAVEMAMKTTSCDWALSRLCHGAARALIMRSTLLGPDKYQENKTLYIENRQIAMPDNSEIASLSQLVKS